MWLCVCVKYFIFNYHYYIRKTILIEDTRQSNIFYNTTMISNIMIIFYIALY